MLISANIFQPLIDVFEAVLKFFHNSLGTSWGWSIVLLTVCVRLVLVPLMLKQFHSMQRMQAHMPELKALQNKYKEDKQRQQQEVMKFYRENNINPMASCLPLVLQLPVFLSLFYMLRQSLREDICPKVQAAFRHTYQLKHPAASHSTVMGQTVACGGGAHSHAGFLFINDLTNTGHGLTLVVLLVLYVGTQMASTVIMSAPTMDPNQRRMMMFLPVVFVVFIIRFPAGLIVYWITTNAWTMLQQWAFKQRLKSTQPPGGGDGGAVAVATATGGRTRGTAGGGAATAVYSGGNGSAEGGGGLAGLLRGGGRGAARAADAPAGDGSGARAGRGTGQAGKKEPVPTPAASRGGSPPPPPRKKKKRSGRRR